MTTRRNGAPRGSWRTLRNATLFVADVAYLGIARFRAVVGVDVVDAWQAKLKENTGERLLPEEAKLAAPFCELQGRFVWNRGPDPRAVVFDLIGLVGRLWERPDRSANSVANKVHRVHELAARADLNLEEVTKLELRWRLLDLDPEQRLDANQRLAFEAAWLSGQRTFARQLVERELRTA